MNLWGFLLMIIPFLIAAIPFGDYSVAYPLGQGSRHLASRPTVSDQFENQIFVPNFRFGELIFETISTK